MAALLDAEILHCNLTFQAAWVDKEKCTSSSGEVKRNSTILRHTVVIPNKESEANLVSEENFSTQLQPPNLVLITSSDDQL